MPSIRDVAPGDSIGSYVTEPIHPLRIKMVASLMRDPVPTHFDRDAVKALGMGDRLVNQGVLNCGYLMELLYRFVDRTWALREFEVSLSQTVHEGDQVECSGTISSVDPEGLTAAIALEAKVDGARVLAGTAVVALDP